MYQKRLGVIGAFLAGVISILSGCSAPSNQSLPSKDNAVPNSTTHSPQNGDIISLKKINDSSDGTTLFEMLYESEGNKVAAYLEVPQKPGNYPMMVICHGGWAIPRQDLSHDQEGYPLSAVKYHPPTAIWLYPEYSGYMDSDGHPQGLLGAVEDIQNAITAAQSATSAKPSGLYLSGASLGGGAVLMVASERKDVKAVSADSPDVGIDLFDKWYMKLGKPKNLKPWYDAFAQAFGTNPNSKVLEEQSVTRRIPNINSPCLIFQGTADNAVLWQTVADFASQMKQAGKTVKYVQIPGGTHAAVSDGKYPQYSQLWFEWFKQYGFPFDA